jgi:hypothetical protein
MMSIVYVNLIAGIITIAEITNFRRAWKAGALTVLNSLNLNPS